MAPIFALLAIQRPFDGEDAVAAARRFLVRMGVSNLGGLRMLVERHPGEGSQSSGLSWGVGFDGPAGRYCSLEVGTKGVVLYANRAGAQGAERFDPAKARRFGERLIRLVPQAIPVRQDPSDPYRFHAIVNGRRYFNLNPSYGYRVVFDANGAFVSFVREDRLPPLPTIRTPKITRTAAVARLTSIMRRTPPTNWPYPRFVEPELGYYVRKGEPRARLVWRGTAMSVAGKEKTEFGPIKTLVDAATGATFEVDDQ